MIFTWQLLRDRLSSGVEVVKRFGPEDGTCPLCAVSESGIHILFSCHAAHFLWSFLAEPLGFLEVQANCTGKSRCLFWLVFAAMN